MCIIQEQNTNQLEEKAIRSEISAMLESKANVVDVYKIIDEIQKTINILSQQKQSDQSSNQMYQNFLQE